MYLVKSERAWESGVSSYVGGCRVQFRLQLTLETYYYNHEVWIFVVLDCIFIRVCLFTSLYTVML